MCDECPYLEQLTAPQTLRKATCNLTCSTSPSSLHKATSAHVGRQSSSLSTIELVNLSSASPVKASNPAQVSSAPPLPSKNVNIPSIVNLAYNNNNNNKSS